jgi:diguanylate cyclase (GGDEF)-like protein
MIVPKIPSNEALRIQTLLSLNILDTPPEERFDRLTRIAKRVFNVPIALVSLVDVDRQWFKSCQGLSATQAPRDISFCGHAILGDDIFVIPDAASDIRFFDNPFVTKAPHIRFYAGCPLVIGEGCKLGTLCIIDDKPRTFSEEDRNVLRDLASMVEQEIKAMQLATRDELTGLSNRRGFEPYGQYALNICERLEKPVSLLFFDLDNFKAINDRYGHAEGDQALITFANELQNVFRESDAVARLCGDEFVVLLTNTSAECACAALARLEANLTLHQAQIEKKYALEFSVGKVEYEPDKHGTISTMLIEADAAMYAHKHAPQRRKKRA